MTQMAQNGTRYVTGEFVVSSGLTFTINHNLGTKKLLVFAQRVNSDHSNIDSTNRYNMILAYGITEEAQYTDVVQTYSLNGGNQIHFEFCYNSNVNNSPIGLYSYFPSSTDTMLNGMGSTIRNAGPVATDSNNVVYNCQYTPMPGRWIYKVWSLD